MLAALKLKTGTYMPLESRDDPRAEYVITTIDEYDRLIDDKRECVSLKKDLKQKDAEACHYKELNENLYRITRERANQDRGIENKKEHDGYFVLSTKQCTDRYERDMTMQEFQAKDYVYQENHGFSDENKPKVIDTVKAWRTVLQTPYSIDIEYDNIYDQIIEEIVHRGILYDLHVEALIQNGTTYKIDHDEKGNAVNTVYRVLFEADFNSGLWNVEIHTTQPVYVPEDRRLPKGSGPSHKKNNKNQG